MQGRRSAMIVRMDDATREQLVSWLRATKTPRGLAKRAMAVLFLADGQSYAATARQVSMRERHVRKWAKRFLRDGPVGLHGAPRSGRKFGGHLTELLARVTGTDTEIGSAKGRTRPVDPPSRCWAGGR